MGLRISRLAIVGEVGEGYVIDVQHWRHYYLIMGMVWGFAVAGRAPRPADAGEAARSAGAPAPG